LTRVQRYSQKMLAIWTRTLVKSKTVAGVMLVAKKTLVLAQRMANRLRPLSCLTRSPGGIILITTVRHSRMYRIQRMSLGRARVGWRRSYKWTLKEKSWLKKIKAFLLLRSSSSKRLSLLLWIKSTLRTSWQLIRRNLAPQAMLWRIPRVIYSWWIVNTWHRIHLLKELLQEVLRIMNLEKNDFTLFYPVR